MATRSPRSRDARHLARLREGSSGAAHFPHKNPRGSSLGSRQHTGLDARDYDTDERPSRRTRGKGAEPGRRASAPSDAVVGRELARKLWCTAREEGSGGWRRCRGCIWRRSSCAALAGPGPRARAAARGARARELHRVRTRGPGAGAARPGRAGRYRRGAALGLRPELALAVSRVKRGREIVLGVPALAARQATGGRRLVRGG